MGWTHINQICRRLKYKPLPAYALEGTNMTVGWTGNMGLLPTACASIVKYSGSQMGLQKAEGSTGGRETLPGGGYIQRMIYQAPGESGK